MLRTVAGVGLASGLIVGLIIGAIEKSKEGEIVPGPALAHSESGYIAPCGSNGVYIGCDAGQCRALHTIKLEGDE